MSIIKLLDNHRGGKTEIGKTNLDQMRSGNYRTPVIDVHYLQLIRTVFNLEAGGQKRRRTVALVSIDSGGGTTSVTAGLSVELTCYSGSSTVIIGTADLCYLPKFNPEEIVRNCHESRVPGLWRFKQPSRLSSSLASQEGSVRRQTTPFFPEFLNDCIGRLSQAFVYVLLDCQPLSVSSDALILAPMVEGIVLVIEAGRTTREQINRARKMIEMSGGKVLGFVLNKRQYPIPASIYRLL